MTIESKQAEEVVKRYHGDLVTFLKSHQTAAEQETPKAADTSGFMMTRIRALLDRHIAELEAAGERRFGDPKIGQRIKEALAKATGWTFGAISGLGSHGTSKMLRDEYLFLNATSIGYAMLYTTEVGAHGDSPYAGMLVSHLEKWNELIVSFNRSLPGAVLNELSREEAGFDKGRAIAITERLQGTWKSSES